MAIASAAAALGLAAFALFAAPAQAAPIAVHFLAEEGEKATIFNQGKLKLKAACAAGGTVEVRAFTKRKKKRAAMFAATAESNPFGLGELPRYLGVDKFHSKTDGFQLLGASPGLASSDNAVGTIVVTDRKRVIGIEWLAESGGILGADCLFGGIANVAAAKSDQAFVFRADSASDRVVVSESEGKLLAECAAPDDTDIFFKTGISVGSAYISSFSDFDSNSVDEAGYNQAEAINQATQQLDGSSVADNHSSGTIVLPGSNERVSTLWLASSSGGLGKECVFAGIETKAGAGNPNRIAYARFGPSVAELAFERQGLQLTASCTGSDLGLAAASSETPAAAHWSVVSDANLDDDDLDEYGEDDILDAGLQSVLSASGDENALGRLVYARADGRYVAADFAADEGGLSGNADCAVAGVVATAE